ncbi:hypothetical protein JOD57_003745 [Geodermatophilus bullaregiensis]|nr:hypothetical protein [Geodermatophilus bullaregiensis]
MGSTYCLVLSGPLPSAVVGAVRDRFEDVRVCAAPAGVVIECSIPDQAALRALLTQVWDVGGAVVLVAVVSSRSERSRHGHDQR